jgi:hypothetical protein
MMRIDEILTSQDLRLMADIGFMAASGGFKAQATAIFAAIHIMRPQHEAGLLGGAIVHILSGDYRAATRMLEKAPVTPATRAFLGIALIHEGNAVKGRRLLQTVVETAPDTPFAQLAQDTLVNTPAAAVGL